MKPLVTVIIVTYNHEAFIGECLSGALAQSYQNLQILVLDDASTDRTHAVAARYVDPRITYIRREKNLGLIENHNQGLALAKGDLIWAMGGDDCFIDPEAVATAVSDFEKHPDVGFAFSRPSTNSAKHAGYFDCGSVTKLMTGNEVACSLAATNMICGPATVARGLLFKTFAKYPAEFAYVGDWYFWFRFSLESKEVLYRPNPSVFYRFHDKNLTNRFASDKQADRLMQEIQLRLAMLELSAGVPGLRAPIMKGLDYAVSQLFESWMNQPGLRNEILRELGRSWELQEIPRSGNDLRAVLRDVFLKTGRYMTVRALCSKRPVYFLRSLKLQILLPKIICAASVADK